MYMCVYMCVYIYIYIVSIHLRPCTYSRLIYIYIHVYIIYVCMCIYIYIYINNVYTYTSLSISLSLCIYTHKFTVKAMYRNAPELVSEHGVKYQFTFNTWGAARGEDPPSSLRLYKYGFHCSANYVSII